MDYYLEEHAERDIMCRECKREICLEALDIECPLDSKELRRSEP